jgi:serine phosphatase RsbU (regulator of sigma subunit)
MMPEMDGYQVICELKGDRKTVSIPVIFLTAKSQEEEIVKGFQLGAVDYIPKPFQREVLLARVRTHLNLKNYQDRIKRDHQRLKLRNLELEKDMSMARNIQMKLIPEKAPSSRLASFYKPMESIGGDFFDFFVFSPSKIGIFLSDVSGHGVAAAFVTSMIKSFIKEGDGYLEDPAEFLKYLNNSLIGLTADNFATAFYGIYDFDEGAMTYSTAGHNAPFFVSSGGIEKIAPQKKGLPLAIYDNAFHKDLNKSYENFVFKSSKEGKILFYTDGLTEATPLDEELLDFESLMEPVLRNLYLKDCNSMITGLYQELVLFRKGENFADDICIIALET